MMEEFLLYLPLREKVGFYGLLGFALLCQIFGESKIVMFRGLEKDPSNIWSSIRFHVSLQGSISKTFCSYSIDSILYNWSPFFLLGSFSWAGFLYVPVLFHFYLSEVVVSIHRRGRAEKKKKKKHSSVSLLTLVSVSLPTRPCPPPPPTPHTHQKIKINNEEEDN